MNNAGIVYNARIPEALDLSSAIFHQLDLGEDSWLAPAEDFPTLRQEVGGVDIIITVGGDGTILRAVQAAAPMGIPMVGINMGRLGFMTELQVDEALNKLPTYFNGETRLEERCMLQATVMRSNGVEDDKLEGPYHALNDVVLARGGVSRVVTIAGRVDNAQLTTFRADAVILSTATGSTGYNLAVGGPILDPLSDALVLKPVAAHMGLTAAMVLDHAAKISLALEGYQPATLSVDGQFDYSLEPGDIVDLEQSPLKAKFLRANPPSYFYGTLTRRLGFSLRGQ
jgi:NAD+ kinase